MKTPPALSFDSLTSIAATSIPVAVPITTGDDDDDDGAAAPRQSPPPPRRRRSPPPPPLVSGVVVPPSSATATATAAAAAGSVEMTSVAGANSDGSTTGEDDDDDEDDDDEGSDDGEDDDDDSDEDDDDDEGSDDDVGRCRRIEVGDSVETPYGPGRVEEYREEDEDDGGGMYVDDNDDDDSDEDDDDDEGSDDDVGRCRRIEVGDSVETPYGPGRVEEYREEEDDEDDGGMYVVRLKGFGGTLYARGDVVRQTTKEEKKKTKKDKKKKKTTKKKKAKKSSMELNAAYEALETMRKLNLEVECQEAGIVVQKGGQMELMCKSCLLEGSCGGGGSSSRGVGSDRNRFSRLQKFVDDRSTASTKKFGRMWARGTRDEGTEGNPKVLPRIQQLMDRTEQKLRSSSFASSALSSSSSPCLICAHRCCSARHSSSNFRKEGIALCTDCERFFELDFILECASNDDPDARRASVDHMIDLYDRCMLLLRYSSQFVDGVAANLDRTAQTNDRIGLGSSGVGVVSGALGVAAAATILTPAGPPLLVASLVFGGSATAVQTGAEARGYFSEPRRFADRIIALHGMAHSVLRVAGALRDACCMDHIRVEAYAMGGNDKKLSAARLQKSIEKNKVAIEAGARATT
eukprot:CAMPEP_0113529984 /NCGR_PEP_ID=MMETSP0015_2-20120614/2691_1 /TAXON_ID=2838 /ORGANISM="Odontella" /LENGTH=633 /DNA_ID=CAMNT_0000428663 /DNA_START=178 /DNA_END=2078 /DNA_ORIENTATION=- /assembly_acc=CAM_ASM_000160